MCKNCNEKNKVQQCAQCAKKNLEYNGVHVCFCGGFRKLLFLTLTHTLEGRLLEELSICYDLLQPIRLMNHGEHPAGKAKLQSSTVAACHLLILQIFTTLLSSKLVVSKLGMLFKKWSCESHKTPVALQGEAIPKPVFALCLSQTYVWHISSYQWKGVTRGEKDLSSTYKISRQSRCGKRVFLSKAATKPCPQSLAIPAVIYCFGISCPGFRWESLLHCHNFITIYALIKWQGSHKAALALSLRRIKQAFVSCRRSPGCLFRCMSVYFYSLRISSPSCLSSPAPVTPACLLSCLSIPLPIFTLDRVCPPALISSSVSVQPDLTVVSGLFQTVTGWLTDLWAD